MEECQEESHCWKKAIGIPVCSFSQAMLETQQTYRRWWTDQVRPKLNILTLRQNDMYDGKLTLHAPLPEHTISTVKHVGDSIML